MEPAITITSTPARMESRTLRHLKGLKRTLRTNAAYEVLGDKVDTWTSGGCLLLATTLHEMFGGELRGVWSNGILQHAVLKIGDVYVDADGTSTETQILARWRTEEGLTHPILGPYAAQPWYCPRSRTKRLKAYLRKTLRLR